MRVFCLHGSSEGRSVQLAIRTAVPVLTKVIMQPGAREKENLNATENAIAAVTKIMKHHQASLNMAEIVPVWFSWLPVTEDKEEAGHIYDFLCDLVATNNAVILGANNENLPNILSVIAEAFAREALTDNEEVFRKCSNIVREVQNNNELWALCLTQLNEEHQHALVTALQMTAS
eukprot:XP_799341.4 PREDICTED: importin-5 [Strongylocentrotus purpuratus]